MPLTSRWGTESRTRDPLHLTSAPRPVVSDFNRITDSHRDFVCDDTSKPGVFNLDCGTPPPPPPPPTFGPGSLGASVRAPAQGPSTLVSTVKVPSTGPGNLTLAVDPPDFGPSSLGATVVIPSTGPSSLGASVAPPVAGPGSLDAAIAVIAAEFNISPYLGNSYDTEDEIFALQNTAPDGLVAYNESTHTLYIWVATQSLWHKFVWEFNIAPLEASQDNFVRSAPVGNDNIKFAEDVDHIFINDGTDWHQFKEE